MPFVRARRLTAALVTATVVSALAACGSDDTGPTAQPDDTVGAVSIVEIDDEVSFYPACGNEVLDRQGVRWYPVSSIDFPPENAELKARLDAIWAVDREPIPDDRPQGVKRVAAPGPGDDIGTLVIWADGVARWTSRSGDLDVWLVDDEFEYTWVC